VEIHSPYIILLTIALTYIVINYFQHRRYNLSFKRNSHEKEQLLESIFENASVGLILVGKNADVLKINKAALEIGLNDDKNLIGSQPGKALNCIVAVKNEKGCGFGKECKNCELRLSIESTIKKGTNISRLPLKIHILRNNVDTPYHILLSTSYLETIAAPMVLIIFEDINALIKTENALIDSEYRYRQITKAISDYVYKINILEDGTIQTIHTQTCYQITGYRPEEFDSNQNLWFDIVHEEDKEKVLKFVQNSTQNTEKYSIEHRIIRKDEAIRWVTNTIVTKKNQKGQKWSDGIVRDITDRKEIEAALRESEEKLSVIFEYSHVGISLIDNEGNIQYMNPAFCKLLGLQPDKTENNFRLFTDPEDAQLESEHFESLRKGEVTMLNIEKKYTKKHGEETWVLMQVSCFRNYKGEVANFIAVVEDITERKNALDLLRQSEEKFRNIFNTSNDGIIITNFEGYPLEANQISLDRVGLSFEQFKKQKVFDYLTTLDHSDITVQFKNLFSNKITVIQSEYLNQLGEKKYVEISGRNINYLGQQAALLISRDITDRKLLQQKILNAIIESEEKERKNFAQELHDGLGPILSTIKLYLQWIENPTAKSNKTELLKEALDTVEEAIISVKEISNKLSPNVLSKYGLEIALQSFVRKIINTKNIEFVIDIELPKRLSPELETMLYRVCVEAINNTVKYAEATIITIQIDTNANILSALYLDNGKGFDVGETTKNKSGHGLFNMQNRIETYGGNFTLNSQPGAGMELMIKISMH
jgi:PAS domain S-box-containing protein